MLARCRLIMLGYSCCVGSPSHWCLTFSDKQRQVWVAHSSVGGWHQRHCHHRAGAAARPLESGSEVHAVGCWLL